MCKEKNRHCHLEREDGGVIGTSRISINRAVVSKICEKADAENYDQVIIGSR